MVVKKEEKEEEDVISQEETDRQIEIVLVGNRHVGKTSLFYQVGLGKFSRRYTPTNGVDSMNTVMTTYDEEKVQVKFWDTSGDLKSKDAVARCVYPQATGFIVMYDVTDVQSYNDVYHWMKTVSKHSKEDAKVLILGNKVDSRLDSEVERERHLTKEDGMKAAYSYGIKFMEISSSSTHNLHRTVKRFVSNLCKSKGDNGGSVSTDQDSVYSSETLTES